MRLDLFEELDKARPYIEAALEYSNGTHDWYDIVSGVLTGKMQLWPTDNGALVTEIIDYPRKRCINVFLGGGDMAELVDKHGEIIMWAQENGCVSALISGRDGWARAFKEHGWKPVHRTLEKEFDL